MKKNTTQYVLDTTIHKQRIEVNMTDMSVLKQFAFLNHTRRASTIDVTVITYKSSCP